MLKIKTDNDTLYDMYRNHGTYHFGDAGLDLFFPEDVVIPGNAIGFPINMEISCEMINKLNQNVSYYLYPRSSISKTPLRLSNSVGIVDSGYRGYIYSVFDNFCDKDYVVKKGDRLMQICHPGLKPFSFELVEKLSETERGSNGIGSTGK
jgi:dUTP pyrophosphatase